MSKEREEMRARLRGFHGHGPGFVVFDEDKRLDFAVSEVERYKQSPSGPVSPELAEAVQEMRDVVELFNDDCAATVLRELDRLGRALATVTEERDRLQATLADIADPCDRGAIEGRDVCSIYWPEMQQKWCAACVARAALTPTTKEPR